MEQNNNGQWLENARDQARCTVARLIGRHGLTPSDREDLELELILALFQRFAKFDARRGARATFVKLIMRQKIRTILRRRVQGCRDYRRVECSLDERVAVGPGASVARGELVEADRRRARLSEPELASDLRQALDRLEPELRRVWELLLTASVAEAASILRASPEQVSEQVRAIRDRFEDAGLRAYFQNSVLGGVCI